MGKLGSMYGISVSFLPTACEIYNYLKIKISHTNTLIFPNVLTFIFPKE